MSAYFQMYIISDHSLRKDKSNALTLIFQRHLNLIDHLPSRKGGNQSPFQNSSDAKMFCPGAFLPPAAGWKKPSWKSWKSEPIPGLADSRVPPNGQKYSAQSTFKWRQLAPNRLQFNLNQYKKIQISIPKSLSKLLVSLSFLREGVIEITEESTNPLLTFLNFLQYSFFWREKWDTPLLLNGWMASCHLPFAGIFLNPSPTWTCLQLM